MTLVRSNVSLFTRHHFSTNVIEEVVRIGGGKMEDRHPKTIRTHLSPGCGGGSEYRRGGAGRRRPPNRRYQGPDQSGESS